MGFNLAFKGLTFTVLCYCGLTSHTFSELGNATKLLQSVLYSRKITKFPSLTFMWPCVMINFLIIKHTICTNFSNLFLGWNFTWFEQFLYPSSGVFHCTHSNGICHTAVPSWSCSLAVSKTVWHIPLLCVRWKTPDDGQRNCPKHVEFHSKNKFEK
jgi:hypothetical protein